MSKHQLMCVALVALALSMARPAVTSAQSLADVARAEEARRKTVKEPAKVYTNDDLKGGGAPGSAPPPPVATPPQAGTQKPEATKPEASVPKPPTDQSGQDEKFWRSRITTAQQTVARNKVLLDALQSRVNALNTDFVNTDDPAQRALVEENRKTALLEMDRVKADIDKTNKDIFSIQEEARKAGVPAGWLR
jgi:hypothetical protein